MNMSKYSLDKFISVFLSYVIRYVFVYFIKKGSKTEYNGPTSTMYKRSNDGFVRVRMWKLSDFPTPTFTRYTWISCKYNYLLLFIIIYEFCSFFIYSKMDINRVMSTYNTCSVSLDVT